MDECLDMNITSFFSPSTQEMKNPILLACLSVRHLFKAYQFLVQLTQRRRNPSRLNLSSSALLGTGQLNETQ